MADKFCCVLYKEELNHKKLLLLHRNSWWNGWEFLRGDLEGKDAAEIVSKKILEATGLNALRIEVMPFNYSYSYLKELNSKKAEVACFVAKVSGNIKLNEEYNHYKWTDKEVINSLLDFEEQKKLLNFVSSNYLVK